MSPEVVICVLLATRNLEASYFCLFVIFYLRSHANIFNATFMTGNGHTYMQGRLSDLYMASLSRLTTTDGSAVSDVLL